MTIETDLLPMPEGAAVGLYKVWSYDQMQAYARANIAHVVAPLQAEITRLQAEVERLRSMTAVTMGIWRGDGNLFVHGDYDSIKVAQSLVFSAKRMEKALEDIRSLSSIDSVMNPSPLALTVLLRAIHQIADAAMSKEGKQ